MPFTSVSERRRRSPFVMKLVTVGRDFRPPLHPVIPDDAGNPEPVVLKPFCTAFGLRCTMGLKLPPRLDCLFITPEGEGQDLARFVETFKAFDRDKSVNIVEQGAKTGRDVQILLPVPI